MTDDTNIGTGDDARVNEAHGKAKRADGSLDAKKEDFAGETLASRLPKIVSVPEVIQTTKEKTSRVSGGEAHVIPLPTPAERDSLRESLPDFVERLAAADAADAELTKEGSASLDAAMPSANGVAASAGIAEKPVGTKGSGEASVSGVSTSEASAAAIAAPSEPAAQAALGTSRPSVKGQVKGKPRLRTKKPRKNVVPSAGAAGSAEDAENAQNEKGARPSLKAKLPFRGDLKKTFISLGIVFAMVAVLALFVSWGRWWRYDDAHDLQGQWFSQGTTGTAVVTIDAEHINLSGEVAYSYTIDPTAKTIAYDFGTMHGQGRYWFSGDRKTLAIIDGADYTATSTFFEDSGIWFQGLLAQIQGEGEVLPAGENAIYLVKSDALSADGSSAAEVSQSNAGMAAGVDNDLAINEDAASDGDATTDAAASDSEGAEGGAAFDDNAGADDESTSAN